MTTYSNQVRATKSPKEALTIIAHALDELAARIDALEEGGSGWDDWGDADNTAVIAAEQRDWFHEPIKAGQEATGYQFDAPMGSVKTEQHGSQMVYVFPTPSDEKQERRRLLERQQLQLAKALGPEEPEPEGGWNGAYAKGGPWWLYAHNRELLMSYPSEVRRAMVADVEEDSPKLAYEMGLDVLKEAAGKPDFESGFGALAVGLVDGKPR